MAIDPAEVRRIADLARLHVTDHEAEALAHDLARIVESIDALAEVELPENAESLTYFDTDVHREDRPGECLDRAAALANAPEADGEYFLVPHVLEERENDEA
jgi:aspartyl-tRNA(Asn)/glutamyl-tRNA(Gln) amidotransferase subunit C